MPTCLAMLAAVSELSPVTRKIFKPCRCSCSTTLAAFGFSASRTANRPSKSFSADKPTMVAPCADHSEMNFSPAAKSTPDSRSQFNEPRRSISNFRFSISNLASTPLPRISFQFSIVAAFGRTPPMGNTFATLCRDAATAWLMGCVEWRASAVAKLLNSEF